MPLQCLFLSTSRFLQNCYSLKCPRWCFPVALEHVFSGNCTAYLIPLILESILLKKKKKIKGKHLFYAKTHLPFLKDWDVEDLRSMILETWSDCRNPSGNCK